MSSKVKIFAAKASKELAKKIAEDFGNPLEILLLCILVMVSLSLLLMKRLEVAMFLSYNRPHLLSENLMELLLMIDAAKRASAYKIIGCNALFWLC